MASTIDPALASRLKKEFRDRNKAAGEHALKTPDGSNLNGFFISRETLESILKNEKVAGIHVHLAKHPDYSGKDDHVNTLLVSGSEPNTQEGAAKPYVSTGETHSDSLPCPPWCN
ncbi:hypothetical protein [Mucilaginibacter sp.]|jgi:hypothetical protein|uniref:hypothetical protein n=1 Tax=Mucilaginibacter sp. TaxID=1882438 RepID=UPI002BED4454|nr:hypothetical protein [Mucilaginibacter sp.]HTI60335.1 hypothetical protein [Mucilaginibacter sp.]